MNMDLDRSLELAITWAKEVGKIHLSYFRGNNLDIHTKPMYMT